jgi:integrase
MPKELTAPAVAKLKPRGARYAERVSRNLYVIVQPGGSKSWAVRFGGEKLVLGPVDFKATGDPAIGQPLALHGARELAAQVLRERNLGRDPVAEHRAAKQRRRTEIKETEASTFGTLVRQYVDEHLKAKRMWRYMAKQLGLHYSKDGSDPSETKRGLAQAWAERDVRSIDGSDIFSVINEAKRHATPGIKARKRGFSEARAHDLHTALSSMFRWLHQNRYVTVNPCIGVWRSSGGKPRERVLSDKEITTFWHGCDSIHPTFAAVFRLLLLTGQRRDEVGEMPRDELQNDGMWEIPGSRTKNEKPHKVPLPPLAMEIIASVPRIEGCPFVFSTTGRTPISGWSKVKRDLDKAMGNPKPWRLHDLRRTAVTGMCELGIAPHVVELVVNHISGHRRGVAGIYNKSVQMDERRKALLRWSQHISGLVSDVPSKKVVSLHSR